MSWADNEGVYEDTEPIGTYKNDLIEESINMNIREVEKVTRSFPGFKRILIDAFYALPLWKWQDN